jgi:Ca2+-binding EF-hand superfamily protein
VAGGRAQDGLGGGLQSRGMVNAVDTWPGGQASAATVRTGSWGAAHTGRGGVSVASQHGSGGLRAPAEPMLLRRLKEKLATEVLPIKGWVEVSRAARLLPSDGLVHKLGGKGDPYCVVSWNGEEIGRSPWRNSTLEPVWNFRAEVTVHQGKHNELCVQVFDHDPAPPNERKPSNDDEGLIGDLKQQQAGSNRDINQVLKNDANFLTAISGDEFLGQATVRAKGCPLPDTMTKFALKAHPDGRISSQFVGGAVFMRWVPRELRLEELTVYGECWDLLAEEFTLYRPLLLQVRQTYDRFLRRVDERLAQLQDTNSDHDKLEAERRAKRDKAQDECNQQLTALKEQCFEERQAMRAKVEALQRVNGSVKHMATELEEARDVHANLHSDNVFLCRDIGRFEGAVRDHHDTEVSGRNHLEDVRKSLSEEQEHFVHVCNMRWELSKIVQRHGISALVQKARTELGIEEAKLDEATQKDDPTAAVMELMEAAAPGGLRALAWQLLGFEAARTLDVVCDHNGLEGVLNEMTGLASETQDRITRIDQQMDKVDDRLAKKTAAKSKLYSEESAYREELKSLSDSRRRVKAEYRELRRKVGQLQRLSIVKRPPTPRPDWQKLQDAVRVTRPSMGKKGGGNIKEEDVKYIDRLRKTLRDSATYSISGFSPQKLFDTVDRDRSGELDFDEFRSALRNEGQITPAVMSDEELAGLFHAADSDGGGTVSIDELTTFVWGTAVTQGAQRRAGEFNLQQPSAMIVAEVLDVVAAIDEKLQKTREELPWVVAEKKQKALMENKWFVCRGSAPSVPKFLRMQGKVRNRDMSKIEAEDFIKEFWDARKKSLLQKKATQIPQIPGDFLYDVLKSKFGVPAAIAEFAYNLIDACQRFSYDADCELFLGVVQGEICEEAYSDQCEMIEEFQQACRKREKKKKKKGTLKRFDFMELIDSHFDTKSHEDKFALRQAVVYDQPLPVISYSKLFEEDANGDQGKFAETLRDQHLYELQTTYPSIESNIRTLWAAENPTARSEDGENAMVQMKLIKQALLEWDPKLPPSEITRIIATGCGALDFKGAFSDFRRENCALFCQRLRGIVIRRCSPPTAEESDSARTTKALRSLDREERRQLEMIFAELDTDYSGSLAISEISNLFRRIYGYSEKSLEEEEEEVAARVRTTYALFFTECTTAWHK